MLFDANTNWSENFLNLFYQVLGHDILMSFYFV